MISFMESNPNLAVGNVLGRAAAGNLWTNLATLLNEHGVSADLKYWKKVTIIIIKIKIVKCFKE